MLELPGRGREELLSDGFVEVCKASDVPGMMPRRVEVDGKGILICRHRMSFRAIGELCPHKGASMQHGVVMGGHIICPLHQYEFDLQTGQPKARRCGWATVYPCEVTDNTVFVNPDPLGDLEQGPAF